MPQLPLDELQKIFVARFPDGKVNDLLNKHSTFMIGGAADFFYRVTDMALVPPLVEFAREHGVKLFVMGSGSNILFHEEGFRGLVLKIEAKGLKVTGDEIEAEAGVGIATLIQSSLEHDLTGLENWMGLPGTVGGAVRGNAGCNGLETAEILKSAKLLDPVSGEIVGVERTFFDFSYRESTLKHSNMIVLSAIFKLKKRDFSKEEQAELVAKYRSVRMTKQPFGNTTGSFFKNPLPDKPAGMLIDQAGLKGRMIGKAQISEKHANFFLNTGGATFDEMMSLVRLAQDTVREKFGIELEPEVQVVEP